MVVSTLMQASARKSFQGYAITLYSGTPALHCTCTFSPGTSGHHESAVSRDTALRNPPNNNLRPVIPP